MAAAFAATNDRVAMLEAQNSALQTNVEEKEVAVVQNSAQVEDLKREKEGLQTEVSKSHIKYHLLVLIACVRL